MKHNQEILNAALKARSKENKKNFLQNWTESQCTLMERKISSHFSMKPMQTNHGNYPAMYLGWVAIIERLGLAYTSSSSYAGYWVCNTEVYHKFYPGYTYIGFAMDDKQKGYAILWDKEENEIILPL